ncbi:sugar ABC transporter permease [Devriesea agamarum]|uniref:sugar ABC transporter permease n=1 Tax=Devriesea agamarum TaxID=472569 RepID=UPI00071E086C|nr:ABC transporter permease subunit [Devriesea agamarum]
MTTSHTPASSDTPARPTALRQRKLPLGRWMREVGWRHLVGLIALAFAIFPILYVISASLNPLGTISSTQIIPREVSFENYSKLLSGQHGPFLSWYLNTVIVCVVVSIIQVFLSVLASYAFSRFRFTGRRGGLLCLLLIMMFPAILAMISIYSMISDIGQVIPLFGLNTLPGYILVLLGGSLGQVWLIKGFFDTVPKELDEAAIIDGCSHWQVFSRILLPALTPILATTLLLSLVGVMSDFLLGSLLLTDDSTKTLAVGMYGLLNADKSNNLGVFAAGSVLIMIPVIALYQFLQRYIIGGSTAGAVKG